MSLKIPKLKVPKLNKRHKRVLVFAMIASIIVTGLYVSQTPPQPDEGYVTGAMASWVNWADSVNIKAQLVIDGVLVDSIQIPAGFQGIKQGSYLFEAGENVTVIVMNYDPESGDPIITGVGSFVVNDWTTRTVQFFDGDVQAGSISFSWVWRSD